MHSPEEIRTRQAALRARMAEEGIDVLVTGASAQMDCRGLLRYLIGYYLPVFEEYLVISAEGSVVFFAHDACGAEYASRYCAADEIRIIPGHEYNSAPGKCVAAYIKALHPQKLGIANLSGLCARFYLSLRNDLEDRAMHDFTPQIARLKMIKSPAEIALSEAAVRLNESVFYRYVQFVKPGASETDAINAASGFALALGAEDLFWMSASGPIPRIGHLSGARQEKHVWQKGDYNTIVLEHSLSGGYFGETTHLISLGKPKPEYVRAFGAVCEAQRAAAACISPGATVDSLAVAAEGVLAEYGYSKPIEPSQQPPAIGHGQGLDVWEHPCIVRGDQTVIAPGMRFCIHPAVTLADGATITSCDNYVSDDAGARRISSLPYEIIAV